MNYSLQQKLFPSESARAVRARTVLCSFVADMGDSNRFPFLCMTASFVEGSELLSQ